MFKAFVNIDCSRSALKKTDRTRFTSHLRIMFLPLDVHILDGQVTIRRRRVSVRGTARLRRVTSTAKAEGQLLATLQTHATEVYCMSNKSFLGS